MSWILLVLVGLVAAYFFYTNCMKLTKQEQESLDKYLISEHRKHILKQESIEKYIENTTLNLRDDDYHFREAIRLVKADIQRQEELAKIKEQVSLTSSKDWFESISYTSSSSSCSSSSDSSSSSSSSCSSSD